MDWANQPDPFRRFPGARNIELPLVPDDGTPPYDAVPFQGHAAPATQRTEDPAGTNGELAKPTTIREHPISGMLTLNRKIPQNTAMDLGYGKAQPGKR